MRSLGILYKTTKYQGSISSDYMGQPNCGGHAEQRASTQYCALNPEFRDNRPTKVIDFQPFQNTEK